MGRSEPYRELGEKWIWVSGGGLGVERLDKEFKEGTGFKIWAEPVKY